MALHEDSEEQSFSEYNYDDELDDLSQRKKVKRMLEERLERNRLKDEFKDDFDEPFCSFNSSLSLLSSDSIVRSGYSGSSSNLFSSIAFH